MVYIIIPRVDDVPALGSGAGFSANATQNTAP